VRLYIARPRTQINHEIHAKCGLFDYDTHARYCEPMKEPTINVRVPVSLWEEIRAQANVTRRSASTELAIVIEEALAARKVIAAAAKRKAKA
jgi:hypothetical protein